MGEVLAEVTAGRVDLILVMVATFPLDGGTAPGEFETVARTAVKKVRKAAA